jgi:hypothetical protein
MHTATNAMGTAVVDVPDGGMVSALRKYSIAGAGEVYTYRTVFSAEGLEDGGTFRVHVAGDEGQPEPALMHVTVSYNTTAPNAVSHKGVITCGSSFDLSWQKFGSVFTQGCPNGAPHDVYLFALNSAGQRIAYDYLFDQPFVAGGSASHAMTPTKTNFAYGTVSMTHIPQGVSQAYLMVWGRRPGAAGYVEDRKVWNAPGWGVSGDMQLPSSGLTEFYSSATWVRQNPIVKVEFIAVGNGLIPSVSWPATSFAWVDELQPPDVTEVGRPVIRWTLSEEGTRDGLLKLEQEWGPNDHEFTKWQLSRRSVSDGEAQFPALPAELAEFVLGEGDFVGTTIAEHEDLPGIGDDFGYLTDNPSHTPFAGHDSREATAYRYP